MASRRRNVEKWAPYAMAINGVAGVAIVVAIVGVLLQGMPYDVWTAIAGSTIWCKFFADFGLSRHAHGFGSKNKGGG